VAGETIKKYVGIAGDALANVWQALRAEREASGEADPPVGAKDTFKGAGAIMGIPFGTLALVGLAWYFLRGK